MKLTIIVNNGGYPRKGGIGMGMLIEEGEKNLLLECGPGVVSGRALFCVGQEIIISLRTYGKGGRSLCQHLQS
jgi:ribonuclease BN (tRNA processing enzyme)